MAFKVCFTSFFTWRPVTAARAGAFTFTAGADTGTLRAIATGAVATIFADLLQFLQLILGQDGVEFLLEFFAERAKFCPNGFAVPSGLPGFPEQFLKGFPLFGLQFL